VAAANQTRQRDLATSFKYAKRRRGHVDRCTAQISNKDIKVLLEGHIRRPSSAEDFGLLRDNV